jgi:hypothetical protein
MVSFFGGFHPHHGYYTALAKLSKRIREAGRYSSLAVFPLTG